MMNRPNTSGTASLGAPGFSLPKLLRDLSSSKLRTFIPNAVALTELVTGSELSNSDLAELVLSIRGPVSLLRDESARAVILDRLPLEKKEELARQMGDRFSVSDLSSECEIRKSSSAERALLRFFGYVDLERRRAAATVAEVSPCTPEYGLFDYQRTAAQRILKELSSFPRKVVLHLPTGSGKTRCALHVICRHLLKRSQAVVVWLAYNQELLEQAASEFEKAWGYLGDRKVAVHRFWGDASPDFANIGDCFVVAGLAKLYSTYQSASDDVLSLADRTTLLVFDEAHQAIAPTYRELSQLLSEKRPDGQLLGLTATPGRTWADVSKDRELAEFFGAQKVMLEVEGYSNPVRFLIDEGYLASPSIRTLNVDAGLTLSDEDRQALQDELDAPDEILERLGASESYNLRVINEVISLLERHRRVLVFACSVEQARTIAAVLQGVGVDAYSVSADTPKDDRERWIRTYRSNVQRGVVLVNYGVLTTGFDAPQTSAAVIARATKSLVLYSQMLGRAMRGPRAGGNAECEIVTVVDPSLPGFGNLADAFTNWEDVWNE